MVDTKQARWVYRVARNFAGVCFCGLYILTVSFIQVFTVTLIIARNEYQSCIGVAVQLSVQCDTKNEQSKDYCKADRNNVYCFVPLVHTLLTALLVILSTLQVKHARVITSHITCNTRNVMCIVQCNRCNLQYIGKTK